MRRIFLFQGSQAGVFHVTSRDEAMALVRTQLELWTRSGLVDVIEEWRQRQLARIFNLRVPLKAACIPYRFAASCIHGNHG
jgi:hypothetical protein